MSYAITNSHEVLATLNGNYLWREEFSDKRDAKAKWDHAYNLMVPGQGLVWRHRGKVVKQVW